VGRDEALLDSLPDIVARYDRQLRHVYVNRAVERELGLAPEVFLGRTHAELGMSPPLSTLWEGALRKVLETGEEEEIEFEFPTPASPRRFQVRIAAETDATGGVTGLVAVGRSVRPAGVMAPIAEERLRELTEHLRQVFWMMAVPELKPVYVSPAYERIWGRPVESVYREPASVLASVHPDDRETFETFLSRILREEVDAVEYRVLRPDGTERWVSSQGFPVHDADGRIYRIAGVAEDVTERRRAEGERRKLLEVVTHDLRSPLAAILLQADLIQQLAGSPAHQTVRNAAAHIVTTVSQMERLITDLMSAATIEAGRLLLRRERTRVRSLLEGPVERLRPIAESRGITLTAGSAEDLVLDVDPDRLTQVLVNLLDNAVRHTPDGGTVTLRGERRGDTAWLLVEDTGPGIPEHELLHVFERYWQAQRGTSGGAGLGLAIAKGIVEAHGGRIWAVSHLGRGSTFIVALSLASPE
jgi:PAS domain S-box-containing protein